MPDPRPSPSASGPESRPLPKKQEDHDQIRRAPHRSRRSPQTATSIGVLLAQAGFAAGATVGGVTLDSFGVATIPLVGLAFVVGSIIIATTLRNTTSKHHPQLAFTSCWGRNRPAPDLSGRQ